MHSAAPAASPHHYFLLLIALVKNTQRCALIFLLSPDDKNRRTSLFLMQSQHAADLAPLQVQPSTFTLLRLAQVSQHVHIDKQMPSG